MNTGIQDALVLSPLVQAILEGAPAIGRDSAALALLRRFGAPLLLGSTALRRRVVRAVSQYDAAARVIAFRRAQAAR